MTFRVGQEVTPIESDLQWTGSSTTIKDGEVYVIAGLSTHPFFGDTVFLELREIPGHFFDAREFRPIVKTSIDIFTAMLNPTSPKQVERV